MPPHKSIYWDSSALQVNDNDDDDDGNDALEFGMLQRLYKYALELY